jgi:hypothetical protein
MVSFHLPSKDRHFLLFWLNEAMISSSLLSRSFITAHLLDDFMACFNMRCVSASDMFTMVRFLLVLA